MISMRNRRSLVIVYGDLTFDGRAQRIVDIARSFGQVTVVDTGPSGAPSPKGQRHVRVVLNQKWGVVRRHLTFWWHVIAEASRFQPDIVFAENFFATLPGWLASRLTKAKLVYDAYELIVPEPGATKNRRLHTWYVLERFVVRRADAVMAANPERATIMTRHYGLRDLPTYMRNIPPNREVSSESIAAARETFPALKRRGLDDVIVLYQGDISLARGLERFVFALDFLPERFRLVIAGDGPDLDRLRELAARHLSTGRFAALGRVPNTILPSVTANADVGVVTYPFSGLNNIYCAPNKIFEYTQAGLPVIASSQPPILALLSEFPVGETFSFGDSPERLAEIITGIVNDTSLYAKHTLKMCEANSAAAESARVTAMLVRLLE
jgi:glycosyltransferase involved in cell wall biosynthesis